MQAAKLWWYLIDELIVGELNDVKEAKIGNGGRYEAFQAQHGEVDICDSTFLLMRARDTSPVAKTNSIATRIESSRRIRCDSILESKQC